MSETMAVQEHLYDAAVQITEMIDFGIDAQSLSSGRTPMPPQGVRFNTSFQGEYTGAKLKGRLIGTGAALVRADNVSMVKSESVLTTLEGDRIAVHADAIYPNPAQGSTVIQWRGNISFHTASSRYSWVNSVMCWETGTIDLATGKMVLKGYIA